MPVEGSRGASKKGERKDDEEKEEKHLLKQVCAFIFFAHHDGSLTNCVCLGKTNKCHSTATLFETGPAISGTLAD